MEENQKNSDNQKERASDLRQPKVNNEDLDNGASLDDGPLDLSLESRARAKQDPNEFRPHDDTASSKSVIFNEENSVEILELFEETNQTIPDKETQEIVRTTQITSAITPELTQENSTQTCISGINPALETVPGYQMAPQIVEYTIPQPPMEQREYILPAQTQYIQSPHNLFISHSPYHSPHAVNYGLPLTQTPPQYVMQIPPQYAPQYPQLYSIQYPMPMPVPITLSPQYIPHMQNFPVEQQMQAVEYSPRIIITNRTLQQPIVEYADQQLHENPVENVPLTPEMQEPPEDHLQALPVATEQPPESNAVKNDDFPVLAEPSHSPKNNDGSGNKSCKRKKSKFIPMEVPINYSQYKATQKQEKKVRPQRSRRGEMEIFSDHVPMEKSPDTSEVQKYLIDATCKSTQDSSRRLSSQRKEMQNSAKEASPGTTQDLPIETASTTTTTKQTLRRIRGTRYYSSRIVWNSDRSSKGPRYRLLLGSNRGPHFRQSLNVPYKSPKITVRKCSSIAKPQTSTLSTSTLQSPKKLLSIASNTQQPQGSDLQGFVKVSRTRLISSSGNAGRAITKTSPRDGVSSPLKTLATENRFAVLQEDESENEENEKQTQEAVEGIVVETSSEKLTAEESSGTVEEVAVTNEPILSWYEEAFPEEVAFLTASEHLTFATPCSQETEQVCTTIDLPNLEDAVPRSDSLNDPEETFIPINSSSLSKSNEIVFERKISWHEETCPEDVIQNKPTPTTESKKPQSKTKPAKVEKASTSKNRDLDSKSGPNAVSTLKDKSKAPTVKKSEEKTSKKQSKAKKNDEKKTKQTTDQSTSGDVSSCTNKKTKPAPSDTLVTLSMASTSLPVISKKVEQNANNDGNGTKKKSRRKRKTKKQSTEPNPNLIFSNPDIFCFGGKKVESGVIPKNAEKPDLSSKPGPRRGQLSPNCLNTIQDNTNHIMKMAIDLQGDDSQPNTLTKRRKLTEEDKWIDLTFQTAGGLNTQDYSERQKTQSDLSTKYTAAISKRKTKKPQKRIIRPQRFSSQSAPTTSDSQGILTNDAAEANDSNGDNEQERKLATMQCTEKADSDNDEETRNAQVEAVKVLLNDSFNPDLHLSASENSTESEDYLNPLEQIQEINTTIGKSQDRIEYLFSMLAEIDVDTNKVLDELSVIGDQIAVHNKQIKEIKRNLNDQKSESSSPSLSYVTASQQDTPRETASSTTQTPRYTNLPMIATNCNMESRVNLLYHLEPSFKPLVNGDITASFLKSWIYRKRSTYENSASLVVTSEINMVARYRNNLASLSAQMVNPKYEDLFNDKHILQVKLIIPYGHSHLDLVVERNKKQFIITFRRTFNEVFYDFETESMTGFKIDPDPNFVNTLDGPYNYRFIAVERNSDNLYLIATKNVTAIFIKLHANPGFVVHEKYSSSSSREYKEFAAKTKSLEYVQWEMANDI